MKHYMHKIGAIFYILWGVLHITIGITAILRLIHQGGSSAIAMIGSAVPENELPCSVPEVVSGILLQHFWNLIWFGIFAVVVGICLNWRNNKVGYWMNLSVVSAADIGFVFAIMVPGYIKFSDAIFGPVFWILAAIFSTIGILSSKSKKQ